MHNRNGWNTLSAKPCYPNFICPIWSYVTRKMHHIRCGHGLFQWHPSGSRQVVFWETYMCGRQRQIQFRNGPGTRSSVSKGANIIYRSYSLLSGRYTLVCYLLITDGRNKLYVITVNGTVIKPEDTGLIDIAPTICFDHYCNNVYHKAYV